MKRRCLDDAVVWIDGQARFMCGLNECCSCVVWIVLVASGEHSITNHQRRDISLTLPFSGPLVEKTARQARNRCYRLEAPPLNRYGLYRVDGFRDHQRMNNRNRRRSQLAGSVTIRAGVTLNLIGGEFTTIGPKNFCSGLQTYSSVTLYSAGPGAAARGTVIERR